MEQQHRNKEDGKQVHLNSDLFEISGDQVNQNITQQTEDDTVCDAVSQRNCDNADECRDGFGIIIQIYFFNAGDH